MVGTSGKITAAELRRRYQAGGEIAIVDAREEGVFHERHLLMASCLPLSRLELIASGLLPRRAAPVVVCDDGEGLAERAAARVGQGQAQRCGRDGGRRAEHGLIVGGAARSLDRRPDRAAQVSRNGYR